MLETGEVLHKLARWAELAQQEHRLSVMHPDDEAPDQRGVRAAQRRTVDEVRGEVWIEFLALDRELRALSPASLRALAPTPEPQP